MNVTLYLIIRNKNIALATFSKASFEEEWFMFRIREMSFEHLETWGEDAGYSTEECWKKWKETHDVDLWTATYEMEFP